MNQSFERVLDWSRSAFADASRDKAYKIQAGAGWTQRDEEQLAAVEVFAGASQSFYLGGGPSGPCGFAPPNFSFPDPAFFAIRIPHALPTPSVSALAGKQQLDLTATLDVRSIALSQRPPSLAELLPPELAKAVAIPQFQNGTPAGEFVTFDTTFIEARWSDPGGKEVARLGPEHGDDLDGLVKRYQAKTGEVGRRGAHAQRPLWPRPCRGPARDELRRRGAGNSKSHEGRPRLAGKTRFRRGRKERPDQAARFRRAFPLRGRERRDRHPGRTARREGPSHGGLATGVDA